MRIDVVIEQVKWLISFFKEYRETRVLDAIKSTKNIATELEINPLLPKLLGPIRWRDSLGILRNWNPIPKNSCVWLGLRVGFGIQGWDYIPTNKGF